MKKRASAGLVVEGSAIDSTILRLPNLARELGPVKSSAIRISRRLSNLLRAGYAVLDYEELQAAKIILLHVPDTTVPRVVGELCDSELILKDLSFALCDSWLPTEKLDPLRRRGAAVATLIRVPSARRKWFIVEGDAPAVRQLRRFIERSGAKALELRAGAKSLYFAALLFATVLPVPFLLSAQNSLRACGISGNPLHALMDEMAQCMFNDLQRGGRTNWAGPLSDCAPDDASVYLEELRRLRPDLAEALDKQLPWVRERIAALRAAKQESEESDSVT